MTILAGVGGSTALLSTPPPDTSDKVQPVPPTATALAGSEDARHSAPAELQKPVAAATDANETSLATKSDAREPVDDTPKDTPRSLAADEPAVSIFDRPAIPLPVEEYLPSPKPDDGPMGPPAPNSTTRETTEKIMDGIASSRDPLPKGEALNKLVPMPDGTQTQTETEQNTS